LRSRIFARDFGGDAGSATWLVSAYLIAMASLQPLGVSVPLLVGSLLCAGAGLGLSNPPTQTAGVEALAPLVGRSHHPLVAVEGGPHRPFCNGL
jgi:hypothetical protein